MDDKKTIFNYISRAFAIFGIIVAIFMIFSLIIGSSTEGYSSLFRLGKEGLSMSTLAELLLLSGFITIVQEAFLTDRFIRNMSIVKRYILFFLSVMIVTVIMIVAFVWFPINDIRAWVYFFICYVLSCVISVVITKLKERAEDNRMQEALEKYNNSFGKE